MKTVWVVLIAIACLALGAFAGTLLGGAGGVMGGSLAGVCHTAQVAVKEGLLTEAQRSTLLQAIASKHVDTAKQLAVSGDLQSACKDMLAMTAPR